MENKLNEEKFVDMGENMKSIENRFQSKTMCTAKWLQTTLHLQNGFTHSCHHPKAHKIPTDEIRRSPSALHNTAFKLEQRAKMLNNIRPEECDYCWNIEDLPGNNYSDRTYKSIEPEWSMPYLDEIENKGANSHINPSYLEVSFENTCNFKCAYCSPDISSKWLEEIKQYGPYPTTWNTGNLEWLKQTGQMPILNREYNPYVEAFWDWWPNLYPSLHTFRITGGEPLLSKNTWKVLEYIKKNPKPNLSFAINTNLGVPDHLIDKLLRYYSEISPNIKRFDIYTSAEAWGSQCEYIRYGMDYQKFIKNCKKILSVITNINNGDNRLHFMITFNLLSVTTFVNFLSDIIALRNEYNQNERLNYVPIMTSYVRWPKFLDVRLLTNDIKQKFKNDLLEFSNIWSISNFRKMKKDGATDLNQKVVFYMEEINQFDRLIEYMVTEHPNENVERGNFYKFITEYDKRKNLNFYKTFPELSNFYDLCKEYK